MAKLGIRALLQYHDFLDISRKQTGQKKWDSDQGLPGALVGKNSLMLYKLIKSMPGFFMQVKVVFSLQFVTHYSA